MVRIIGIDPGLNNAGYGIIDKIDNKLEYVACGSIKTNPKDEISKRLKDLHNGVTDICNKYQPQSCGIEETFVNKNPLSSLKLGHARGCLMLSVNLLSIDISEYSSTKIKKSIVGVGRADKNQITMMVKHLLPKSQIPNADAADALAIAICHSMYRNF